MVYILSVDGRDADHPVFTFERYERDLGANRGRFPVKAFELATSGWFDDPRNHRCPHDARLQRLQIREDVDPGQDGAAVRSHCD